MAHFYLSQKLESAEIGARVTLGGQEARHAVTVSRIGVGERVSIGDGAGTVVTGTVTRAEPGVLELEIDHTLTQERPTPAIVLAQALAKGDRDELAVQAATELGVDAVIPWSASRSVSRWEGAKIAKGHERWSAVVREATKQSMRAWLPDVLELATTKQLARLAESTRMLVLEPTAPQALSELEFDERDIVLVVGPEGGIAPAELDVLAAAGASAVRLGSGVLRTSTAGPAAIAVLSAKLRRW